MRLKNQKIRIIILMEKVIKQKQNRINQQEMTH